MRWRSRLAAVALMAGLAAGPAAPDESTDLQALHDATLQAFQSGDTALATTRAEAAMTAARAMTAPNPETFALGLNNLAYMRANAGNDTDGAIALWRESIAYLTQKDRLASEAGFTALTQLAQARIATGDTDAALPLLRRAVDLSEGSGLRAPVAGIATDLFLDAHAYSDAILTLGEMERTHSGQMTTTYPNLYTRLSTLADQAEATGTAEDLATLLEGKIILVRAFLSGADQTDTIRNLRFQRYFALRGAGVHDRASQELLAWLAMPGRTAEEQTFVDDMVDTAMQLADGANIDTLQRLTDARAALTFARGVTDPDDPRLGLALRTLASAEGHFGQFDNAARSLGDAIAILDRSPEGRRHLHLLYDHLAWNRFQAGDTTSAARLFAAADVARTPDAIIEPPADRAVTAGNRARFHLDQGDTAQAGAWLDRAQAILNDVTAQDQTWQSGAQAVRVLGLRALVAMDEEGDIPVDALIAALDRLRPLAPADSPEFAMMLANAADTALVAGRVDKGRALLHEAVTINDAALPDIAPQAIDTRAMLARLDLLQGHRKPATDGLRRLTEARKSPLYRAQLPQARWDFELLAWSLLHPQDSQNPARVSEAFEALQWTHVTRSAEALSALETSLSVSDPRRAALLARRRDLIEDQTASLARLTDRTGAGSQGAPPDQSLATRVHQIEAELSQTETTLNALGLETAGIGQITPVSLTQAQALLHDDEALITFLLPSLNPQMVSGLDMSSNMVILLRPDAVHIALIPEVSRRKLNARITAFRCQIAISDPGCDGAVTEGLRGAMLGDEEEEGEDQRPRFDTQLAHGLYRDLFEPVATGLKDVQHLIVVPPSDLLRLPFSALVTRTPTDGARPDWMIRHHAISVLPSVGSLRTLRQTAPRAVAGAARMVGFGDPVIGAPQPQPVQCGPQQLAALRAAPPLQSPLSSTTTQAGQPLADTGFLATLPRLPDTVCELRAIAQGFDANSSLVVLGADASETRVKAMDRNGTLALADVVVFATHGLTAGEAGADSPGLVMTPPTQATAVDDGLLTAAEIATMDLNARLVVLSACNTAAGDDNDADGLSGLARAFFQSGAQALLVTHWSVYSSAAVELTTGLFAAQGRDPDLRHADALRVATLAILDAPGRPEFNYHPGYWAAFTVVGAR